MPRVDVHLGERAYAILIEPGALTGVGAFVSGLGPPTRVALITDGNVRPLYEGRAVASFREAGLDVHTLLIPPGEGSKSLDVAGTLYTGLLEAGIDRKSIVVALGGGVVGDVAGFVAATVLRGVDCVQVPTTLLAQVDSSVGGKTGINHPLGKNLIGAFHQPRGVLVDPTTLGTLPQGEFVAGLAEVVKTALIRDAHLLAYLEDHTDDLLALDAAALTHVITRCCRIKADVVEQDPRETSGLRAILNYGHTVGHALEAVSGYGRYRHGEAVAVGMVVAARIAVARGLVDRSLAARQSALLQALGLPTWADELASGGLITALYRDKKAEAGRWRFVLPTDAGAVAVFDDVTEDEVRRAVADGGAA